MLKLYITTPDCEEDEAHQLTVDVDTPWEDIQTMCRLMYPEMTEITIELVEA